MTHDLLTTGDVARRLGVHVVTVRDWCNRGLLKCSLTLGGHRRFTVRDVERAIKRNNEGNTIR